MDLKEWMSKFAGVNIWWDDTPTATALSAYPYFYIDLLRAWEVSKYAGAREVLTECQRRIDLFSGIRVGHWFQTDENYPNGVIAISVDDSGEMNNGYRRKWEEGLFSINGEYATEMVWHTHDGYGRECGVIEVWAWYTEPVDNQTGVA